MENTHEGIRVGHSPHGLGGFAVRSFFAGECLGPIPGEIVTDPDYGSDYAMELGQRTLEPAAPFRFLNHSCQPNCELVVCEEEDEDGTCHDASVWLDILREIAPGEEMTIDYAWPVDSVIPCRCGTEDCRGWIVAKEQLDELLAVRQGMTAAEMPPV